MLAYGYTRLVLSALTFVLAFSFPSSCFAQKAPSGLILQADEGERRVRRTSDFPFIIKVDRQNGGATEMVMGMENLRPGQTIPAHRHLHSDEIVFVHKGNALVTLGERESTAREGATVYIPKNMRVAMKNPGPDTLTIVFFFSKPGFEEYLRATSAPEGQPVPTMSPEARAEIRKKNEWHTIYEQP